MLTALLTSVDNMEKAIAAPAGDDYKTGVDLVLRQFMEALNKLGLESVGVEGEPFDRISWPAAPCARRASTRRSSPPYSKRATSWGTECSVPLWLR